MNLINEFHYKAMIKGLGNNPSAQDFLNIFSPDYSNDRSVNTIETFYYLVRAVEHFYTSEVMPEDIKKVYSLYLKFYGDSVVNSYSFDPPIDTLTKFFNSNSDTIDFIIKSFRNAVAQFEMIRFLSIVEDFANDQSQIDEARRIYKNFKYNCSHVSLP